MLPGAHTYNSIFSFQKSPTQTTSQIFSTDPPTMAVITLQHQQDVWLPIRGRNGCAPPSSTTNCDRWNPTLPSIKTQTPKISRISPRRRDYQNVSCKCGFRTPGPSGDEIWWDRSNSSRAMGLLWVVNLSWVSCCPISPPWWPTIATW